MHPKPGPGVATLDGASQAAAAGEKARRGKSGHRRARWSGIRPGETRGKVPQKHTADGARSRGGRPGKVEMVREERTSAAVTRRLGKPHPVQGRAGPMTRPAEVQVARRDGWLSTTESGLPACYGEAPPRRGFSTFGALVYRYVALSAARRGSLEAVRPPLVRRAARAHRWIGPG